MWARLKENWAIVSFVASVLVYFSGTYCFFSYVDHEKIVLPLDVTPWVPFSLLIFLVTALLLASFLVIAILYVGLMEWCWRNIAYALTSPPRSFSLVYSSLPVESFQVARNLSVGLVMLTIIDLSRDMSTKNVFWVLIVLWSLYFAARASFLNDTGWFIIRSCIYKIEKWQSFQPLAKRFFCVTFSLFFVQASLILFFSLVQEHSFMPIAPRIRQDFPMTTEAFLTMIDVLLFFAAWTTWVLMTRSIKIARRKRDHFILLALGLVWYLAIIIQYGSGFGKMSLRFLRFGGEIQYDFQWNRTKCPDIPPDWERMFCTGNHCSAELILKTGRSTYLKAGKGRPVAVRGECLFELE